MNTADLKTLFIGHHFIELKETDSTNQYAQELLAREHPVEGTAILTGNQVHGKGQRGASWESEPFKNLTFSIILHPHFISSKDSFQLSKAVALGVYDYINTLLGEQTKIKWPNDIYYEAKKLGGILIENTLRGNAITHSVIGIGLNINQTIFGSTTLATSLKSLIGKDFNTSDCFVQLCKTIEIRYLQLKASKNDLLNREYLKALFGFGEMRAYKAGEEIFKAKITGISPEGKLILETVSGETRMYYFKEIGFIL